jgi:geranylgeranyl pyrophosphate synthase
VSAEAPGTGTAAHLDTLLRTRADEVRGALERMVTRLSARLPEAVAGAMAHGVLSGGKRLRPILCTEAYRAAGGPHPEADALQDLAASLELIHAYSLMHDDLPCMDDADLRRGEPTTHRVHGAEVTARAGVALIPMAGLEALTSARALGCDEARAREVATVLLRAAGAGGMVGGQGLDLLGEGRALPEVELTELHRHKTGALLTAALVMGALAAGAGDVVRRALERYGMHIGLAFQIADDVLDATASAADLGKTPSDAALEKSTYVALHGVERARDLGRAEVEAALDALDGVGLEGPSLRALARYIVEREH